MASADLSRRVRTIVAYPPLSEMDDLQRREFHEAGVPIVAIAELFGLSHQRVSKTVRR
jgi:hypothetical protein